MTAERVMLTYELTLYGFDGDTDEFDDLVKWVNTPDWPTLDAWIAAAGLYPFVEEVRRIDEIYQPMVLDREAGVDVVLGEVNDVDVEDWKRESMEARGKKYVRRTKRNRRHPRVRAE